MLENSSKPKYSLKLFVLAQSPRGQQAISALQSICEKNLAGICDLTIVDIAANPEMADAEKILASPTLIKIAPLPVRKIIGDFSDTQSVLNALGLAMGEHKNG